ncbi:MAG: molybdate ABC transporter substrate-binding protein [Sulfurimonas sp.]|uniref:molybdate ABC transporter substrate-binding protein n=1 Tax=Sulfurimonas sp. TaxID=2022749 RepID=UPI00263A1D36|nr:molybdate ABC transporter substrate-binding protein [Sulfurimonas sp.]MDD5372710.1 molybdate ABC transporter substrate-binding protein [Sulfurimonas sp.]
MKKIFLSLILLATCMFADKITIFAASDLKFALDEIKTEFLKQNTKDEIEMIYGSSGKGMHQIENGAPYSLFFSANMEFVEKMFKHGDVTTKPKPYALGRVVIWSKHKNFDATKGFDNLKAPWVQKIAIANPTHAPYGEKAKQAMESMGIYESLKSKFIFGENISQTAGFVASEAADIGIIALSLALAPTIANTEHNKYYLIENKLHKPLEQGYGITKHGSNSSLTKKFYDFMETKTANDVMKKYGFVID